MGITLKFGNPKIALCFSGQPRTWRKCLESWKLHNVFTDNVDVFCHIWDFNTVPNCVAVGKDIKNQILPQDEINELLAILKPKKYLIEPVRTFTPIKESQPITFSNFLSQFYGIMASARLKREYEIENMMQYDIVIRMRYDAFFTDSIFPNQQVHLPQDNTMYCHHLAWNHLLNRGRIGDIFWYADSQTYDIIGDYYLNLNSVELKFVKDFNEHEIFFHYIKKNNIQLNINNWDIKLFRESSELAFSKDKNGFETW